MAGIKHSDATEAWIQTFLEPNMTEEQITSIRKEKIEEKINGYGLVSRIRAKLEDGTYALTGDCTVDSVIGKTDEASVALFDTYLQQEYDLCQAADSDLPN